MYHVLYSYPYTRVRTLRTELMIRKLVVNDSFAMLQNDGWLRAGQEHMDWRRRLRAQKRMYGYHSPQGWTTAGIWTSTTSRAKLVCVLAHYSRTYSRFDKLLGFVLVVRATQPRSIDCSRSI